MVFSAILKSRHHTLYDALGHTTTLVNTHMKIIGINGSPKGEKSQTRRLVMGVLEGARATGADVTFVDVCALKIKYCTACTTCYAKGECIHDDDMPALYQKLLDADGIVLGSPVYINSVTAQAQDRARPDGRQRPLPALYREVRLCGFHSRRGNGR